MTLFSSRMSDGFERLQDALGRSASASDAVLHCPGGETAFQTAIAVYHVRVDAEENSLSLNLSDGDGNEQRMREGELILSTSISVTVDVRPGKRDTFIIDGETWHASQKKVLNGGKQRIRLVRSEGITTRKNRL